VTSLHTLPLHRLSAGIAARDFTCREVAEACLARIDAVDGRVGALLSVRAEQALEAAGAADAARARGEARGPLHGLPIVVKANLAHPNLESSCGSKMLAGMRAPYRATALARLDDAGMVVLGTANMDEFAMGSSCENSALARTANPWDLSRVPGGSSGGSAAAVAARMVPAALGSDTGGSIRMPAALCGVCGLKPTYGRISRYGLIALASSLDQIGPMARCAEDLALLLQSIAGADPKDATSLPGPVPDVSRDLHEGVSGLRIGVLADTAADRATGARIADAVAQLTALGAKVSPIALPHLEYAVPAYYLICMAEASSNLSRYDGVKFGLRVPGEDLASMYRNTRSAGFGPEAKRRIMLGTFVLSRGYYDAYYRKAQQVRTLIRRDFADAFETCDVIATPTSPTAAWPIGERVADPVAMYRSDLYSVAPNLAGLPALSMPCGLSDAGLPIGVQLIGRHLDEARLLRIAAAYQRETDWHTRAPAL
jgi:aspartyl-tRNA(Asn)/glutamyl-tRNA(Gln) amidotransferase subunit A